MIGAAHEQLFAMGLQVTARAGEHEDVRRSSGPLAEAPLRADDILANRFRLERPLGEGGMGVVWAAVDLDSGRRFAVKVLREDWAEHPDARKRFVREARAAMAVRHPNIVRVHEIVAADDGAPVMVMDLLRGESLAARLRRDGALSVEETARILLPVISAVGAAHAIGIVHRDLKPDNIFLVEDDGDGPDVRVLDFGIAKLLDGAQEDDSLLMTRAGVMLGTLCYMAPEQMFGEMDLDHRVDVWAIGAILYECLAGVRPVAGESVPQVIKLVTSLGITPLRCRAPHVPAELSTLVDRMTAYLRRERPADLREAYSVVRKFTLEGARDFGEASTEQALRAVDVVLKPSIFEDDEYIATSVRGLARARSLAPARPVIAPASTPRHVSRSEPRAASNTSNTKQILVAVLLAGAAGLAAGLTINRPSKNPAGTAQSTTFVAPATSSAVASAAPPPAASAVPLASISSASSSPAPSAQPPVLEVDAKRAPTPIPSASTLPSPSTSAVPTTAVEEPGF